MHPSPSDFRRRRCAALRHAFQLVVALFIVGTPPFGVRAQSQVNDPVPAYAEHEVKAAFLFHFATYVDWPDGRHERPLVFAILSAHTVAQALAQFADGRAIRGHGVRVREIASVRDLADAEVLFVGQSLNPWLREIASAVPAGTLLVTEADDGLADGAMINFRLVERRVRFEVSMPSTYAAGLKLSSRLLSLAIRVETSYCWLDCGEPGARDLLIATLAPTIVAATRGRALRRSTRE